MKDRIEFRFTVATGAVDSKALKVLGKHFETKLDRLLESITKAVEVIVEHGVDNLNKEKSEEKKWWI